MRLLSNIYHGRRCVYSIQYHLVWCVKYRQKILNGDLDIALKESLLKIANDNEFSIIQMETDEDHIHLLIECSPQHYIPDLVKALKGVSARILFKDFKDLKKRLWAGHLWNPSYFIATVSEQTESQIKDYIKSQKTTPKKGGDKNDS